MLVMTMGQKHRTDRVIHGKVSEHYIIQKNENRHIIYFQYWKYFYDVRDTINGTNETAVKLHVSPLYIHVFLSWVALYTCQSKIQIGVYIQERYEKGGSS